MHHYVILIDDSMIYGTRDGSRAAKEQLVSIQRMLLENCKLSIGIIKTDGKIEWHEENIDEQPKQVARLQTLKSEARPSLSNAKTSLLDPPIDHDHRV